ncbi:hypothetical protein Pfo_018136 [Paulownia fortunei]|nr:hypothetical protein Pfo_018136 [Paulownia fortunei]
MRSDQKNRTTVNSTARAPSAEALENVLDLAGPCFASNDSSCFKENININKFETPKLSLEPLRMKRKKNGGGYNLRKSLAWDRAFFTEEGVLDPLELSVISGASCREGLPFINEDTSGCSQLPIKPIDLQKLENTLLKELQEEDLGKERKKDWSSPELHSFSSSFMTSTSQTSHRVPTRVGSKSGSRCGDCPRPLPSSSLKRPANVNVGKAAGKELKLPKVPGLKPDLSPICATTRSTILRANCVKHNQITQPGLKSSSKSLKNTPNASKASSLRSAHYSDGNSGNSSISMSPVLVDKADNSGSKMISDNMTPARPVNSSDGLHESTTFTAAFSRNAHVSGRTLHPLQNQAMKPSGLRMPSPSLSFFSQPKPSVFRDLSLRGAEIDVCGSQKPGNSRLRDNLGRTPKTDNKIPESTISSSKATCSRSERMMSSHVSDGELIKPNLERNPMQKVAVKIQDLPKKNRIARISHEEAELQKIDMPSQSGSHEQAMDDNFFEKAIDGYPVKNESCGNGWRNSEFRSEPDCAIHEYETTIDEPPKEKNTCNFLVLNHGAIIGTQCEDALDHRVQNSLTMQRDWEDTCKPNCHKPDREQTDPFKYSLGETDKRIDKDKIVLKTREIASEQLGVLHQNGSWCSGSASIESLEHRRAKAENSHLVSKHLRADLIKEAAFMEVLTDNLLAGEAHMQNAVFASTVGDCKNNINLSSEVGDNTKQSGKDLVVQNICLKVEMESPRNVELNTSDRLLPEKQICLQNSEQEKNVEKHLFVVPDRKDGNKVIDTKMACSLSPGKMHDCNFDKDKMIGQPLIITEFNSVDNSMSSESHNNLTNTTFNSDGKHKGHANVLLNGPANRNLSNSLHWDTRRTEIDDCRSFPESRTHEVSQKNTFGKVTMAGPIVQDGRANNWLTSSMLVKESESDMDNLRNAQDSGTVLVQSPESNILDECCFNKSECLALPSAEFVAEKLAHSNDGLHIENYLLTKSPAGVSYEDNALWSNEDSVTGQNEIYLSILKSSSVSAKESPLKHESCNDAYGPGCPFADAITDSSRVKLFSDTGKREVSEDTNSSFSCVHPKLDHVKVEASLAPNNKHGDGLNEKSCSFALPQNAIPFSDEWLAAIEAAGEDILTRKSGAVQNSPPDKSLPEPSPWSPVKKKNNQIGPFDCTKFTNIVPSDSN